MAESEKKEKEDFLYIVRIANRDLKGERSVEMALSDIEGIGKRLAAVILSRLGLDPHKKIGELDEETIEKLRDYVEQKEFQDIPSWALNHRKDIVTGKDMNLVSNDLEIQVQDDINYMKKMKSYRGVRHETHHKVRGQRTRSNGRKGLSIGVIRKKEGAPQQSE